MSPTREPLSRGSLRVVTVVAALASLAMQQAQWTIRASLPGGSRDASPGARWTVEASQEPSFYVTGTDPTHWLDVPQEQTGALAGRWSYYVPPGLHVEDVSISSRCGGGCSGPPCVAPAGANVRVVSVEKVGEWSLTATAPDVTLRQSEWFMVSVRATRRADVLAAATGDQAPGFTNSVRQDPGSVDLQQTTVSWELAKGASAEDARWTPRARIYGACPGVTACEPPAGEAVTIVRIMSGRTQTDVRSGAPSASTGARRSPPGAH